VHVVQRAATVDSTRAAHSRKANQTELHNKRQPVLMSTMFQMLKQEKPPTRHQNRTTHPKRQLVLVFELQVLLEPRRCKRQQQPSLGARLLQSVPRHTPNYASSAL
jgi:hypothetical protein